MAVDLYIIEYLTDRTHFTHIIFSQDRPQLILSSLDLHT